MLFHVSEIHTVIEKLLIKAQDPALFNVWELVESILKNLSKHSLQAYMVHHKFCPLSAFIIMLRGVCVSWSTIKKAFASHLYSLYVQIVADATQRLFSSSFMVAFFFFFLPLVIY